MTLLFAAVLRCRAALRRFQTEAGIEPLLCGTLRGLPDSH